MQRGCYTALIETRKPDGTSGVAASVSGETLALFAADVYRMGTYYAALGYTLSLSSVECACLDCYGTGEVDGASRRRKKRCPGCKGVGSVEVSPPAEMPVHPNAAEMAETKPCPDCYGQHNTCYTCGGREAGVGWGRVAR